jgi:4-hydroxybenzoate polyprenyltransferase
MTSTHEKNKELPQPDQIFPHYFDALRMIGFSLPVLRVKIDPNLPGNRPQTNQVVFLHPAWLILILVILCMVFARSSAMAFNRYLDRNFDARNPRTAIREIPGGIIAPHQALMFTIICCLAFIGCCWFINTLFFYFSPFVLLVILYCHRSGLPLLYLVLGLGRQWHPSGLPRYWRI